MKIAGFEEKYFAELCRHFRDEYFDAHQEWKLSTVEAYVRACADEFPELFLIATDDSGAYAGCAFGQSYHHYEGRFAQLTSIQVLPAYRGEGLSRQLMTRFASAARATGVAGMILMVNVEKAFPRDWYEKLGFRRMNWVEYCGRWEELRL